MTEISAHIPVSAELRERWENYVRSRGYSKCAFLRTFIEAVTDPVCGPYIERVIQNREQIKENRHDAVVRKMD